MSKYKKYIVFQHEWYYPSGGLGDITDSFDTIEECREYISKNEMDSNQIVDRDTWEVIKCQLSFTNTQTI